MINFFRESVFKNVWFIINVITLTAFTTWMLIYPCKALAELMELVLVPHKAVEQKRFRFFLVLFPIAHFITAGIIEVRF